MKNVILLNGSPRLEPHTTSSGILDRVSQALPAGSFGTQTIHVRTSLAAGPETDYARILQADALILAFPLYYFCLPGLLTRFLEDFEKFSREQTRPARLVKVYAIVNCGFPEPEINSEALRVVGCLSRHIGADFRFGVMIGGGPMFSAAAGTPPVRKAAETLDAAAQAMADDILNGAGAPPGNVAISMTFPRRLYFFLGDQNWKKHAKQNGLGRAELYRRPYGEPGKK